jgi:AraC family transcriptional regulator
MSADTSAHSTIDPVIQAMRENLAAGLTLPEMADIACLSPFHFHRVFHQAAGVPPGQFFTALRMDAAKRLLLTTTESITDICFAVGYSSPGSFATGFSQWVGESPRGFRALPAVFGDSGIWESRAAFLPDGCLTQSLPAPALGRVLGPPEFLGVIFVGAFPKRIPQALPVAGTLLRTPGEYRFPVISDGRYEILVAAIPDEEPQSLFLPGPQMRVGIGAQPLVVTHGIAASPVDVVLRPPQETDPPIVVALPLLLRRQAALRPRVTGMG